MFPPILLLLCSCPLLQAFLHMVLMEREQAERERVKEEEERRRRREEQQRRKRMLEAAFDGDTNEINTVLKEVRPLSYMLVYTL